MQLSQCLCYYPPINLTRYDSPSMLAARNLTCLRDERALFSDLSFTVSPGDIVQVEGPNGVGKTSLLRILTGLSQAEQGEVLWQQQRIQHQRENYHASLLYLGHQPGIKAQLTPYENLSFWYAHRPQDELWHALEQVDLIGYEDLPVAQLSAGQQRRVAAARLWLSPAPLWILDEPLTAIDKSGVEKLMTQFARHTQQGGAVVLTTHQELPASVRNLRRICLTAGEG
ncbi:ATP binding protein of heme exporter A [Erwinia piriflorinigrans CFBP 5888]|uniref:ATP binding protein of heme exporter A n=2 Tax=Erwinia piriflorinigrans TaxID=665097 RepID=V5ZAD9_9GAMM|nr:ATP binding protein of heme exporter A [Erwinia piriflorinigrans CFBP 5888]